ncbi:MAG: hypothetical protein WCV81_04320 [Microgenomates group bacterium]|jgi:rubrerythrin
MDNKDILIKMFEDLYGLEKEARDLYDEFLETLDNPEEAEILASIRDDEIRHMEIVQKLKELIINEN